MPFNYHGLCFDLQFYTSFLLMLLQVPLSPVLVRHDNASFFFHRCCVFN